MSFFIQVFFLNLKLNARLRLRERLLIVFVLKLLQLSVKNAYVNFGKLFIN